MYVSLSSSDCIIRAVCLGSYEEFSACIILHSYKRWSDSHIEMTYANSFWACNLSRHTFCAGKPFSNSVTLLCPPQIIKPASKSLDEPIKPQFDVWFDCLLSTLHWILKHDPDAVRNQSCTCSFVKRKLEVIH